MLKLFAVLIALAKVKISATSGAEAIDYNKQGDWGGVCNDAGSKKQSPVDVIIPEKSASQKEALFNLTGNADKADARNTQDKNSIKISFKTEIDYKIPGLKETSGQVKQLHLHWGKADAEGSEHLLNGKRFSAEAHLVTTYTNNNIEKNAVVARFFKVGEANAQIQKMIDSGSDGSDLEISEFNLTALYPSDISKVVIYSGSLTTPDCTENVHWMIVPEPLTISELQLPRPLTGEKSKSSMDENLKVTPPLHHISECL
ncbi:hypothetical protein ACHWQZ_G012253 [Mnemiopsis leidyi]